MNVLVKHGVGAVAVQQRCPCDVALVRRVVLRCLAGEPVAAGSIVVTLSPGSRLATSKLLMTGHDRPVPRWPLDGTIALEIPGDGILSSPFRSACRTALKKLTPLQNDVGPKADPSLAADAVGIRERGRGRPHLDQVSAVEPEVDRHDRVRRDHRRIELHARASGLVPS